jgi:5,10-methylenetetrahydrofolate reductase
LNRKKGRSCLGHEFLLETLCMKELGQSPGGNDSDAGATLLDVLKSSNIFLSVELRPPRTDTSGRTSMEDWIDLYHCVRSLTLRGRYVFITDNAVGTPEEENLRHLVANLGPDAPRELIGPFLTCKHPLDYCLNFAARAHDQGFRTLVVLGGDRHDNVPRCVEHAYQLRSQIRRRAPDLMLGGWANPHVDPSDQVHHLLDQSFSADFYLTQVVSHHSIKSVEAFIKECCRRNVLQPAIFGVFYYRSARLRTLEVLDQFFPVPIDALRREFEEEGATPETICARSIRALFSLGVRRLYISNLPVVDAPARLDQILKLANDL